MFGRKPWVRWPPASSDMPSSRWLPSSGAQLLPVGLGQVVDVLGARRSARPGASTRVARGSPRTRRGWRRCPSAAARRRAARRTARSACSAASRLDGVDVLAAGVEAVPDGALGVLVGEPGAHRQQHRGRGVVLAGDQLQRIPLIGKLFAGRGGDAWFDRFDDLQDVSVGGARGVGVLGARSGGGGTSRSRGVPTVSLQSCVQRNPVGGSTVLGPPMRDFVAQSIE